MVIRLRKKQDFEQLLDSSNKDPVLIFKHSTQCPISDAALDEFNDFSGGAEGVHCGLVFVLENREVSNIISERLGVRHESPQAIVVQEGHQKWNASHWAITADAMRDALANQGLRP